MREQYQHKNARRNIENAGDNYKRHSSKRTPEALDIIKTHQTRDGVCRKGHLNPPIDNHGRCLLCYREWTRNYTKTGTKRYELKRDRKNIARQETRGKAIKYLGGKCCDCGIDNELLFEFDHIVPGPHIAKCMDLCWGRLQVELDKCELVCANCHCIRTRSRSK
jgi:hypothetical protein